jgi:fluoroacetyl-CoA thioesterase
VPVICSGLIRHVDRGANTAYSLQKKANRLPGGTVRAIGRARNEDVMADLTALRPGLSGTASALVTRERLAPAVGSGIAPVFATPSLAAIMEAAAVDCIEDRLPEGFQSLGTHLDIKHSAPTPLGLTVTATATLTEVAGRKLTFTLSAHDGVEAIGSGMHTRVVVDTPRFMARLAAKSTPRP